jgi:hypothetical protein
MTFHEIPLDPMVTGLIADRASLFDIASIGSARQRARAVPWRRDV